MTDIDDEGARGRVRHQSAGARLWAVAVAVFVGFAVVGPWKMLTRDDQDAPGGNAVRMASLRFSPAVLTVPAGTTVSFRNEDVAPHTVTADGNGIDSGILEPGQSFQVVVEERFDYSCQIHPAMKASVEVTL